MPSPRLQLALERLTAGDWSIFELFAAEFLASDYPSLRTMASPGGDKGRDGELYVPEEDPTVAIQYSVSIDWSAKISRTVTRLGETLPNVRELIYVTNQVIGPAADGLRSRLRRDKNISLDVRDASWFIEREGTDAQRAVASEELARRFVDPLLAERGLREQVGVALSGQDARVALLHLALETQNEATDKGLTKSSFESLVLAALHDTDSANRRRLDYVVEAVEACLPAGYESQVKGLVASALTRLTVKGGRVKRHNTTDDYCLSHEETLRVAEQTAAFVHEEDVLERELVQAVSAAEGEGAFSDTELTAIGRDLRVGIETLLLRRGEAFAAASSSGVMGLLDTSELLAIVASTSKSPANRLTVERAAFAIIEVLERPTVDVQAHLRRLSDAYTLMAFLRQTPDVQKVVLKMFSEGDIWLDTSVVLPLLAKTLLDDASDRHQSIIMRAAVDAGLRLFVTEGVVEEVERHLNRCIIYARGVHEEWRGQVPFVYSAYMMAGRSRDAIPGWLENFRGDSRPREDVSEYLRDAFQIQTRGLIAEAESAPVDLRGAVAELWNEAHEKRRSRGLSDLDTFTRDRLVAHDVENTVGVMQMRRQSATAPLGYKAWWLTLDQTAYRLDTHLKDRLGNEAPKSPVLSPEFLVQLLRLGPLRSAVNREKRAELPLMADLGRLTFISPKLLEVAEEIRKANRGVDERIAQRRVRDALDSMRAELGPEAIEAARASEGRVLSKLEAQAGFQKN